MNPQVNRSSPHDAGLNLSARSTERLEWLKAIAGIGGLLTGLVAVFTFVVSSCQYARASQRANELRTEEHISAALSTLTDSKSSSASRVGAIGALSSHLGASAEDNQRVIMQGLAGALGFDADAVVRSAILDLFSNAKPAPNVTALDAALRMLIISSRGLRQDGRLDALLIADPNAEATARPGDALTRAQSVASGIRTLVARGATVGDLSGIFCIDCVFSELPLINRSFENAILAGANFENAMLDGTHFGDAVLVGASFRGASLKNAKFTQARPTSSRIPWQIAAIKAARNKYLYTDFACSDLTNADFSGYVLFPLSSGLELRRDFFPTAAFTGATLSGTRFDNTRFLMLHKERQSYFDAFPAVDGKPQFIDMGILPSDRLTPAADEIAALAPAGMTPLAAASIARNIQERNGRVVIAWFDPSNATIDFTREVKTVDGLRPVEGLPIVEEAFYDSSWRESKLPSPLKVWLERFGTEKRGGFESVDCESTRKSGSRVK